MEGEGSVQVKYDARIVVFKPEINQVMPGTVVGQNERGIFVLVGTATCFIPADRLMKPYF